MTAPQTTPIPDVRKRLPMERRAVTHRFFIGSFKGYITVGLFEDGTPGEVFLRMAKSGSTLAGLLDSLAIAVSLGLQHGIPLSTFANKYTDARFEPNGHTFGELGFATSIVDYIFRWLALRFPEAGQSKTQVGE